MQKVFFDLIQFSIGTRDDFPYKPDAVEWKSLMDLARRHAVLGICFMGVKRMMGDDMSCDEQKGTCLENIPEDLLLQWMGEAMAIEQENVVLDTRTVQTQTILQKDGFSSSILKGQGLKTLYGQLGSLRSTGDIDVWVDAKWSEVMEYILSMTRNIEYDWKHVHFVAFASVDVELHWWVSRTYNPIVDKRLRKFYADQVGRQCLNRIDLPNGMGSITCPDAYFNSIYILLHIFDHFLYEGVSFRQLMDYYFVIIQPEVCQSKMEILQKYKEFGIYEFAKIVAFVLKEAFGLSSDQLIVSPNVKSGKKFLREIYFLKDSDAGVGDETTLRRLFRRMIRKVRLLGYNPLAVVCSPFVKLKFILWKRSVDRRYHLTESQ